MTDEITIEDKSGDKEFFTILPNYILNHSSGDEQALYMQMKRYAGEKGKCFVTVKTLAGKLHWREAKVRSNIKLILARHWIERAGTIVTKTHPVNAYKMTNLWQENTDFYRKKKTVPNDPISEKANRRPSETTITRPPQTTPEEDISNKKILTVIPTVSAPLTFLEVLLKSKQRHVQIIGLWVREREIELPNKDIYESIVRRNLRPAKLLGGYSDEHIIETIKIIENTDYISKFTLETVLKFIDDVVVRRKNAGAPIIKYEKIEQGGKIVMRPIYAEKD